MYPPSAGFHGWLQVEIRGLYGSQRRRRSSVAPMSFLPECLAFSCAALDLLFLRYGPLSIEPRDHYWHDTGTGICIDPLAKIISPPNCVNHSLRCYADDGPHTSLRFRI